MFSSYVRGLHILTTKRPNKKYNFIMPRKTEMADNRSSMSEKTNDIENSCDLLDMASTDGGCLTPTHSSDATLNDDRPRTADASVPCPNETFIIQLRDTCKAITLVDGQLRLCEGFRPECGYHWRCEEKDGWLGFRNCVSGTYIGHDGKKKFIAKVSQHRDHEYFCVRPNPKKGGYELLMRHGPELWRMDVGKDGKTLVETKGDAATWDFFKLGNDFYN